MNKRHIVMLGVVIVALIAMLGSKPFWASLNGETGATSPHAIDQ